VPNLPEVRKEAPGCREAEIWVLVKDLTLAAGGSLGMLACPSARECPLSGGKRECSECAAYQW
jgi:hypothetical protein